MRPVLYLDADGLIYCGGQWSRELRPDMPEFLDWVTQRFRCRWLTSLSRAGLNHLLIDLRLAEQARQIEYVEWGGVENGPPLKTSGIAWEEPKWVWVDDEPLAAEIEVLRRWQMLDRLLRINPHRPRDLHRVQRRLAKYL